MSADRVIVVECGHAAVGLEDNVAADSAVSTPFKGGRQPRRLEKIEGIEAAPPRKESP